MSSSERCGPSIRYVHERSCGKKGAQLRDAEHDSLVIMIVGTVSRECQRERARIVRFALEFSPRNSL